MVTTGAAEVDVGTADVVPIADVVVAGTALTSGAAVRWAGAGAGARQLRKVLGCKTTAERPPDKPVSMAVSTDKPS